jgi:hypothetical protein
MKYKQQHTSTGAKSANLSIVSKDGDESTVNVTLSGSGVWHTYLPMVINNHWAATVR